MTAAVTLSPANAALVSAGVQTIVTLSTKPKALTAGDRLVIHAGKVVSVAVEGFEEGWSYHYVGRFQVLEGRRGDAYMVDETSGQHIDLHPGHIVATAVVRDVVPIANFFTASCPGDDTPHLCMYGDQSAQLYPGSEEPQHGDDVSDQLPFADFTPGRWAVLLDDVTPTTDRCPACWGEGAEFEDSMSAYGIPGGRVAVSPCATCGEDGTCPPIPWKGKPGVWEVTW